jgi:hypothetical protein
VLHRRPCVGLGGARLRGRGKPLDPLARDRPGAAQELQFLVALDQAKLVHYRRLVGDHGFGHAAMAPVHERRRDVAARRAHEPIGDDPDSAASDPALGERAEDGGWAGIRPHILEPSPSDLGASTEWDVLVAVAVERDRIGVQGEDRKRPDERSEAGDVADVGHAPPLKPPAPTSTRHSRLRKSIFSRNAAHRRSRSWSEGIGSSSGCRSLPALTSAISPDHSGVCIS